MKALRYYAAFACCAVPALLGGIVVLGWNSLDEDPIDPAKITYNDLVEADGEVTSDIYVVTPGTPMYLQCVRIGDAAEDSPSPGGGLAYCKWRMATDKDIQDYQAGLAKPESGSEPAA
jgi:hypothetical protein